MRARKVTILLFLTALSLLTIFLVVLLDDTVLASPEPLVPLVSESQPSE